MNSWKNQATLRWVLKAGFPQTCSGISPWLSPKWNVFPLIFLLEIPIYPWPLPKNYPPPLWNLKFDQLPTPAPPPAHLLSVIWPTILNWSWQEFSEEKNKRYNTKKFTAVWKSNKKRIFLHENKIYRNIFCDMKNIVNVYIYNSSGVSRTPHGALCDR